MEDIALVLANNLRRLREQKGWRQADLAEKSGLSLATIQGYEGQRRWPERPYITVLAKSLGVSEIELFRKDVNLPPTVDALVKVVNELQKENLLLRQAIPESLMDLWLRASEQRRRSAIISLGGKIDIKKKSKYG